MSSPYESSLGVWIHLNIEAPCEFLAMNASGKEKTSSRKDQGKCWSCLCVVFTTETIPLCRKPEHYPTICQLRVVSPERE